MTPRLYTYVATALVAGALAAGGAWKVQDWRWTATTQAAALERAEEDRIASELRAEEDRIASELRASHAKEERRLNDVAAGAHAAVLVTLNTKLGDARAHIKNLSDRQCLGANTVRMLNAIGTPARGVGLRAPAGHVAGAAAAPAGSANDARADGYASERDAADHIATCRTLYAAVSDQINQILDLEDQRSAAQTPAPHGGTP